MQAGAQMVKMEGGAWLAETVQVLTRNGFQSVFTWVSPTVGACLWRL